MVVRVTAVSELRMLRLAEETAAPEGSETAPMMLAETWARAGDVQAKRARMRRTAAASKERVNGAPENTGQLLGSSERNSTQQRDQLFNTVQDVKSNRLKSVRRWMKLCGFTPEDKRGSYLGNGVRRGGVGRKRDSSLRSE